MDVAPIIDELKKQLPDLIGAYQFGSSVAGANRLETADSDIDLAILCRQALASSRLFELKQILESVAGRDVDLIDLRRADSVITAQILGSGTVICRVDAYALSSFEVTAMAKYCNLNEERRDVLDAIKKRGFIHAR
jgi:predicted nucleotidyltransferase